MAEVLIGLRHHGARGWTWTVHQPGQVSVWRTNETGRGLQRQTPTGGMDRHGRPTYEWKTLQAAADFALPADRPAALARLRTMFAHQPTPPPRAASQLRPPTAATLEAPR